MQIKFDQVEGFNKVALAGRMDTAGVGAVELRFSSGIVPRGLSTLVDLSQVEFLTSLGVRLLLSTARALSGKGATLVLFGPTPAVAETIDSMGLSDIVPLADTEANALAFLQGAAGR